MPIKTKQENRAETLNEAGWARIFSKLPIVDQVNAKGYFDITAKQIQENSSREPRLMTKIDFRESLPRIMATNGLAILAITNGTYRIGRFDPFITVSANSHATPETIAFPRNIITLNPQDLSHESAALDVALLSGALNKVFGEEVSLTIRGRTRSTPFNFSLQGIQFPISGVQIEVDGGYEGATTINLVEAKIGLRNNINIRQLIYPQLSWENDVRGRKSVRTYLCFYQEPILRFIPILYEKNSCRSDITREKAFIFEQQARLELMSITAKPNAPLPDMRAPFPQADRFDTVLAMLSVVGAVNEITKDDLLPEFDLDPRQIDYYSNVLRWLGLADIDKKNKTIRLTVEGRNIAATTHAERMQKLADIIFGEPIFNSALHKGVNNVNPSLFKRWRCVGSETVKRRLQTVNAWINYFRAYEARL